MTTAAASSATEAAVGFASALRRGGIDVSVNSCILYAEALSEVDVRQADAVYWAGRAALVHRIEDVAVYDAVFGAFWLGEPMPMPAPVVSVTVPIMLDTDDGSSPSDDGDPEQRRDGDVITVRYSAAETLARKDFADCSDEELEEARRLMERLRWQGPTRSSRRGQPSRSCRGRRTCAAP